MGSDGGVKGGALAQFKANQATAANAVGQISPIYQQDLEGGSGYTPLQMAQAYTAAAQSNGGGQAAAQGAGTLLAARNNNVGGLGAAISQSAQQAGDRNSAAALQIQNDSNQLGQQRRDQALKGLSMIYDDSNEQANANLNTANQAARPFWQQMLLGGVQAAGAAAPTIGKAFGI